MLKNKGKKNRIYWTPSGIFYNELIKAEQNITVILLLGNLIQN